MHTHVYAHTRTHARTRQNTHTYTYIHTPVRSSREAMGMRAKHSADGRYTEWPNTTEKARMNGALPNTSAWQSVFVWVSKCVMWYMSVTLLTSENICNPSSNTTAPMQCWQLVNIAPLFFLISLLITAHIAPLFTRNQCCELYGWRRQPSFDGQA